MCACMRGGWNLDRQSELQNTDFWTLLSVWLPFSSSACVPSPLGQIWTQSLCCHRDKNLNKFYMGVPFSQSCTFSWLSAVCSVSLHRHKRCTNSEPSLTCYTLSAPRHWLIPVLSTILEAIGTLELKWSGLICAKEETRDLYCIVSQSWSSISPFGPHDWASYSTFLIRTFCNSPPPWLTWSHHDGQMLYTL